MNVKELLLKTLAEAGNEYVSGAQLAEKIGVSRNAVWKSVKSLENDGYLIESVTGTGYRIAADNNKLSAELIEPELKTSYLGRKMIVLDEVDSTNNRAKELASKGAEHGTTVISDRQNSGKGRLGRSFASPSGTGMYLSVIIRPQISTETAQLITSCTACAAAAAVEELSNMNTAIKWVNDLYMNGRKICGILTEASLSLETRSLDYAVIGIGINVYSIKNIFDTELQQKVTSIEDETGIRISRCKLCATLLNKLENYLNDIESRLFLEEYRRREMLTGNEIIATFGGEQISGKAIGVDENANLIFEFPDGRRTSLGSGEANLCRIIK